MIAKLSGRIDSTGNGWAVVDVGGVGYLVWCSVQTLNRLDPGAAVSLHVETHVREDAIQLYGFLEETERTWFRLLTTVQGVGTRVALGILSVLAPGDIASAVAAGDRATVSRAPGVGPRLAARIVSELKEKAMPVPVEGPVVSTPGANLGHRGDAVAALVNLGFASGEAVSAVTAAAAALGNDAGVEALIRDGLGRLAPQGDRT